MNVKQVRSLVAVAWCATVLALAGSQAQARQDNPALVNEVIQELNDHDTVKGAESAKLYKALFDAYLQLTKPPREVGAEFNLATIHPKMAEWSKVSGWAESNAKMADAILKCKDNKYTKVGLPYGKANVDANYSQAGIYADIGVGGSLRNNQFPYLKAVDTIAAFATAESYRLLEAKQTQRALDLQVALAFVVRQFCDREFLAEKLHFVDMLSEVMENLRGMFYVYMEQITADQYKAIAQEELPFLRPDRSRLFMPEADRVVAEALLKEVFNPSDGQPIVDKFTLTFAEVQSKDAPLTIFGAAKRWEMIANIHGSLDASLEKLQLVYDDWWRRWRIDLYDEQLLSVPSQFDRVNRIRYAAVLYSLENLAGVFAVRNTLVADVNGTAMAAALCAYKKVYGTYPDDAEKLYGQSVRKRSDSDPWDKELGEFRYRLLDKRTAIAAGGETIWVEGGSGNTQAMIYSVGQDHEDGRGASHSPDGATGDLVIWPPIRALEREAGLVR
jgi:hypothetical protein